MGTKDVSTFFSFFPLYVCSKLHSQNYRLNSKTMWLHFQHAGVVAWLVIFVCQLSPPSQLHTSRLKNKHMLSTYGLFKHFIRIYRRCLFQLAIVVCLGQLVALHVRYDGQEFHEFLLPLYLITVGFRCINFLLWLIKRQKSNDLVLMEVCRDFFFM